MRGRCKITNQKLRKLQWLQIGGSFVKPIGKKYQNNIYKIHNQFFWRIWKRGCLQRVHWLETLRKMPISQQRAGIQVGAVGNASDDPDCVNALKPIKPVEKNIFKKYPMLVTTQPFGSSLKGRNRCTKTGTNLIKTNKYMRAYIHNNILHITLEHITWRFSTFPQIHKNKRIRANLPNQTL